MSNLRVQKVIYTYEDKNEVEYTIEKVRNTYFIVKSNCYRYSSSECDDSNIEEHELEQSVYCKVKFQFKCNVELTDDILEYELSRRDRRIKIYNALNDSFDAFYDCFATRLLQC